MEIASEYQLYCRNIRGWYSRHFVGRGYGVKPYLVRATLQLTRRINPRRVAADQNTSYITGTEHIVHSNIRTKWYLVFAQNHAQAIERCKVKAGILERTRLDKTETVRKIGNIHIMPIKVGIVDAVWVDIVWR